MQQKNEPIVPPGAGAVAVAVAAGANAVVVGIDVAKAKLDVYVDAGGDANADAPAGRWSRADNDAAGVAGLIAKLGALPVRLVVVEATGRYHRRLAGELLAAGIPVALVNPQRARAFARAAGRLEKTDRVDAAALAAFGRGVRLRALDRLPAGQAELDDLIARRRALVQMRVAEANRLGEDGGDPLPRLARAQGRKLLRLLEQQVEDLDRAIATLVQGDDDWRGRHAVITSVPGVGDGTAHQLIADLPELGRLDRGGIAKLVGVAPLADDSGGRGGARHIRGGRGPVRSALYMAAFNAMRFCDRFKRMAERMRKAGKAHQVIVTACMRKLLVTLNQMVKTNTTYDPAFGAAATA